MPKGNEALVPVESIAQSILLLRAQKVLLDADLAELYGMETKPPQPNKKRPIGFVEDKQKGPRQRPLSLAATRAAGGGGFS